jgi:hypothetical protein
MEKYVYEHYGRKLPFRAEKFRIRPPLKVQATGTD